MTTTEQAQPTLQDVPAPPATANRPSKQQIHWAAITAFDEGFIARRLLDAPADEAIRAARLLVNIANRDAPAAQDEDGAEVLAMVRDEWPAEVNAPWKHSRKKPVAMDQEAINRAFGCLHLTQDLFDIGEPEDRMAMEMQAYRYLKAFALISFRRPRIVAPADGARLVQMLYRWASRYTPGDTIDLSLPQPALSLPR